MDGSIREEAKITQKMIPAKKLDNRSNNYPSKYECHLWYIIMYTWPYNIVIFVLQRKKPKSK